MMSIDKLIIRFISIVVVINVICGSSFSQNVPDSVFNYAYEQLHASRDSITILNQIKIKQDTIISNQNRLVKNDSIIIMNNDEIIKKLRDKIYSINLKQESPFIVYKGFYCGISAMYQFNDSILTKPTVINGMVYDLTGSFKVSAGDVDLSGIIGIPLRSEKFYLKASIEYKLF